MTEVRIVDTGVANIASLIAAFSRLGCPAALTLDPAEAAQAPYLVLPGVGSFGAGMARLGEAGLWAPLRERIAAGRPTLAVCLGLQLLCERSEESPGVAGLGVIPASVTRFGAGVRVPQFGWNRVTPVPASEANPEANPEADPAAAASPVVSSGSLLTEGYAYFANSYRLAEPPQGFAAALADHGGPFVAALQREALLACQFHPELSGPWGQALLGRWLERGARLSRGGSGEEGASSPEQGSRGASAGQPASSPEQGNRQTGTPPPGGEGTC
jgi:imidazoleglycerol phosphate synthase glutamine amidotransferase subunit HisH